MYKIVIADDEPIIREGMQNFIEWSRFNCTVCGLASNGEEAYQMISEIKPHVAFLDLKMPVMNGIEVIAKGRKVSPHTKFIITSGYSDFNMARDAMKLGVTYYLLKPFSSVEIEEALTDSLSYFISEDEQNVIWKSVKSREVDVKQGEENVITKVCRYVNENLNDPNLTLSIVAKEVAFMNASYFGRLFKKVTGFFYTQYVMNCRLEKAKQILTDTDYKICDVASMVGFGDSEKYFGQAFKRYTGMTPGEYRNQKI